MDNKRCKSSRVITTTVDKTVLMHLLTCPNSYEMLEKIELIYRKDEEQEKNNILQDFFSYQFTTADLMTNISHLENLVFKLRMLKTNITDEMVISKLLSILPAQYKYFTSAWESTRPEERTLINLISRLNSEESRHHNKAHEEPKIALYNSKRRCFNCKKKGKFCKYKRVSEYDIPKDASSNNQTVFCKICKKNNHVEHSCYFRNKPKRPNTPERSKPKSTNLISFLSTHQMASYTSFIVDSGASSHMTNNEAILKDSQTNDSEVLVASKGNTMKVNKKGKVSSFECDLKDVLYVPNLQANHYL